MIIGTGVDIIEINRFADKDNSPKFMSRIFTANEQNYLKKRGVQSMAGLFAAKEAVVKALGTGFKGFWPCDVEIAHDKFGKPYVILHGAAKRQLKKEAATHMRKRNKRSCFHISVSISHNEKDVIAFAVIECRPRRF